MLISANIGYVLQKSEFVELGSIVKSNMMFEKKPRKKWIFLRFFYAYIPSIS